MWKGKMTQEEEDLEELSSLEIREDHGAEDSDVTPINTPPTSPPILYVKKYPPIKPPEGDETHTFQRFTKREDYDCRSESSLSWGDDEFEGEATKQVSILFDQVDYLLYGEKMSPFLLPSPEPLSPDVVDSSIQCGVLCSPSSDTSPLVLLSKDTDDVRDNSSSTDSAYGTLTEENQVDDNQSTENLFSFGKFLGTSTNPSSDQMVASEPPAELKQECRSWVNRFPHFRARGHSIDPIKVKNLEETLLSDCMEQEEELIAHDGNIDHLLPLVAYTSANQVKTSHKDNLKQSTPSSRVCSGSNDPEVLKEQILIALFEQLWEKVTKTIDPLLHQYAKYIIEQSVQYLSISREPSTRGSRLSAQTFSRSVSGEFSKSDKFLSPMSSVDKFNITRNLIPSRPLSGIRRPSSAVQRLPSNISIPNIRHQEELHELLNVSTKALQNGDSRNRSYPPSTIQTRESSASSRLSQLSLPLVHTPRDSSRPVSSKSTSCYLAPVNTKNSTSLIAEQRPASTSSYNTRMRIQERFQHLNRQFTIQELGTDNIGSENEGGLDEHLGPVWSRHIPFLPPITDSSAAPVRVQQFPPITRDDRMLTMKGTMMSASHRSDVNARPSKTWGIPITENREGKRQDSGKK